MVAQKLRRRSVALVNVHVDMQTLSRASTPPSIQTKVDDVVVVLSISESCIVQQPLVN